MVEQMPLNILCVYCCKVKPLPTKGEHIILKGLGGRATTKNVCYDCNKEFGDDLDNKFLRHGPLAYYRYLDPTVKIGQVGGVQFVPSPRGGFLDATIHNSQDTEIKTQVHIVGNDFLVFRPEAIAAEAERMIERLKGIDLVIKSDIVDAESHEPPRFIPDMKGKSHLIRARTAEQVELVRAAIKKGSKPEKGEVEPVDITGQPVMLRMSFDPNIVGRCAAKMAFNLASMIFGAEPLVHERFNPVRDYIRGENAQDAQLTNTPDGKVVGVLDERFVDRWFNEPRSQPIAPTSWHIIELAKRDDQLVAQLHLVGGIWKFFVRLGPFEGLNPAGIPAGLSREDSEDYWLVGGETKTNTEVQATVARRIREDSRRARLFVSLR